MSENDYIKDNLENIQDIAPFLASISKQNPFDVPEHYFNELATDIEFLTLHNYSTLSSIEKKNIFSVPANYFEQLSNDILSKTKEQGVILPQLKENASFEVPNNYFKELPERILHKIKNEEKKEPIIRYLFSNVFTPKFAVAASIALILSIISIKLLNNPPADEFVAGYNIKTLEEELQSVDESAIVAELANYGVSIETDNTNKQEIVNYLIDNGIDESSIVSEL